MKKPGTIPSQYISRSDKMAELARNYHHDLLSDDLNTDPGVRAQTITEVLTSITPESTLPNRQKATMSEKLTEQDVRTALKFTKNGTATGINGLPYELWKTLDDKDQNNTKANRPAFNIIKVLTRVYNDIERYGVEPGTDFAEGWMCPLYKKKDRRQIANYRPITLLNTDYKIFTKALATKLSSIIHTMIHANQAGFIPKRSIFDQVKLAKLMIDYAEATEEKWSNNWARPRKSL